MSNGSIIERLHHLMSFGSHIVLVSSPSAAESASLASSIIIAQEESAELVIIKIKKDDLANKREFLHQLSSGKIAATTDSLLAQSQAYIGKEHFPSIFFLLQGENGSAHFFHEICTLYGNLKASNQASNVIIFVPTDSLVRVSQIIKSFGHDSVIIEQQHDNATPDDRNALNSLIAENRARLAQRIAQRNISEDGQDGGTSAPNNITKSFLIMSCILLFVVVFVGLLWLVYDVDDDSELQGVSITTEASSVRAIMVEQQVQALQPDTLDNVIDDTETPDNDNSRVTNWISAINKIDNSKKIAQTIPAVVHATEHEASDDTMTSLAIAQQDIVDDKELPTGKISNIGQAVISNDTNSQIAKAEAIVNNDKLSPDNEILQKQRDTAYVIQLAAMTDPAVRAKFISSHALFDKVWQYTTKREGVYWYVVLANQSYPSAAAARQQIAGYSQDIFTSTPFVKSVSVVKKELL